MLAGVFGALMAVIATEAVYDYSLYDVRNSVARINRPVVAVINSLKYIYRARRALVGRTIANFRVNFSDNYRAELMKK